jgi:hypothetical protein
VFDVKLYTGNSSTQTISGLGFSPDFVWLKARSAATAHLLFDQIRGATYYLSSNATDAESNSPSNTLTAFNSDGFTLGSNSSANGSSVSLTAWTWDAGSSTVTNTQGSITSQVRANATAGFSVVTYQANAPNNTIGHGLGATPSFVIVKSRSRSDNWYCYHSALGVNYWLNLNTTSSATNSTSYWGTSGNWTSTTFGVNTNTLAGNNYGTELMVAYCFAPVSGYSNFGSYVGNGSGSDGPFVYTGMRPKFLLIKRTDASGYPWVIVDSLRDGYNLTYKWLEPNSSSAEQTAQPVADVDFLSNGFKLKGNGNTTNQSSGTYVFASFAENPFQYARAR